MNKAKKCHEVVDGIVYVDAFHTRTFGSKTKNDKCHFILTHYHSDHYVGLPRDGLYEGPALIHCTPITASLLRHVHKVPSPYIVSHPYNDTWTITDTKNNNDVVIHITFYDAHHCPGAAMVFVHLPETNQSLLHTGDFRFHPKMMQYPLLQQASKEHTLDTLFLDTTYAHPKHNFCSQSHAIHSIASIIVQDLQKKQTSTTTDDDDAKTLVLISCYSIGKEKILWETMKRLNHHSQKNNNEKPALLYVTEKKLKMLQCIPYNDNDDEEPDVQRYYTTDPNQSNIHVIPMGMAGELFPYFQPNYHKCVEYAKSLPQKQSQYTKIIAIIPSGWAQASKWNIKHSLNEKVIDGIHVEIRLVPYSEHSSFTELCTFANFLQPRQIIPTVFSNDTDYRSIEQRFVKYIDNKRAKQHFLQSIIQSPKQRKQNNNLKDDHKETCYVMDASKNNNNLPQKDNKRWTNNPDFRNEIIEIIDDNDNDIPQEIQQHDDNDESMAHLVSMGFDSNKARQSLKLCQGNLDGALDHLLSSNTATSSKKRKSNNVSGSITNFFQAKSMKPRK